MGPCVGVTVPVHVTPLTVNDVGTGFESVNEPMKPNWVDAPVPSEPFQPMLDAETREPLVVTFAFHDCETRCPEDGNVHATVHDESGDPRLVILTSPWNPEFHWLWTV